jgi:hypothetical protein
MAKSVKHKLEEAGHKIAEVATKVGHTVGEKVGEATEWVKEKTHAPKNQVDEIGDALEHRKREAFGECWSPQDIQQNMSVIGSCGNMLGMVEEVDCHQMRLTANDSPDGRDRLIPLEWVSRVDDNVHLSKNCWEAKQEWQPH